MKRMLTLLTLVLSLGAASTARGQEEPDSLALARQYTAWLYAGEADSLLAHSSDELREEYAGGQGFVRYSDMIAERAGIELEVIEEAWKLRNGDCQYWRTASFSKMEEPLLIRWVLDPAGRIEGIGLGPRGQAPAVEAETCWPG